MRTRGEVQGEMFRVLRLMFAAIFISMFSASYVNAQTKQELDLAEAKKNFDANQSEDNYIWYGRRTAYTGDYDKAIAIYTEGLKKYPKSYKLLRHRGHRYISKRKFDLAIDDLNKAEKLMAGTPIDVEPDGIPNKLNKPLSSTQFNVFYHLALAYYLKGDFAKSETTWKKCLAVCENDDSKVAVIDWLYMTMRRQGKHDQAKVLLNDINESMEIIENDSYYQRLLMYKNGTPLPTPETPLDIATLGYGLGNWYYYNGDKAKAKEIFEKVVSGKESAAFGYIAAETDLKRI